MTVFLSSVKPVKLYKWTWAPNVVRVRIPYSVVGDDAPSLSGFLSPDDVTFNKFLGQKDKLSRRYERQELEERMNKWSRTTPPPARFERHCHIIRVQRQMCNDNNAVGTAFERIIYSWQVTLIIKYMNLHTITLVKDCYKLNVTTSAARW